MGRERWSGIPLFKGDETGRLLLSLPFAALSQEDVFKTFAQERLWRRAALCERSLLQKLGRFVAAKGIECVVKQRFPVGIVEKSLNATVGFDAIQNERHYLLSIDNNVVVAHKSLKVASGRGMGKQQQRQKACWSHGGIRPSACLNEREKKEPR